MAHFAKIVDGLVEQVIVVNNDVLQKNGSEDEQKGIDFCKSLFGNDTQWVKCSYNTYGNVHKNNESPLRGNFPNPGYVYDNVNDVFYAPQPYPSWTLNSNWIWEAPVAYPDDGNFYDWNEETQSWDLVE